MLRGTKIIGLIGLALLLFTLSFVYVGPMPSFASPRDTVVLIKSKTGSLGSGVVIAPGKIITAFHVVGVTDFVEYKGHQVPFTVLYGDSKQDYAIIQAIGVECPCARLSFKRPAIDEELVKIGFGLFPSVQVQNRTDGRFMGLAKQDEQRWMIVTSPVAPGDSGGGIFVKHWGIYYLVGIVSAVSIANPMGFPDMVNHLGLAVPIEVLHYGK